MLMAFGRVAWLEKRLQPRQVAGGGEVLYCRQPAKANTAAKLKNAKCGMPGTIPMIAITEATVNKVAGEASSWFCMACVMSSSLSLIRVTIIAAEVANSSEGICATRPSPIVVRRMF